MYIEGHQIKPNQNQTKTKPQIHFLIVFLSDFDWFEARIAFIRPFLDDI
jgi:hypothetical protein